MVGSAESASVAKFSRFDRTLWQVQSTKNKSQDTETEIQAEPCQCVSCLGTINSDWSRILYAVCCGPCRLNCTGVPEKLHCQFTQIAQQVGWVCEDCWCTAWKNEISALSENKWQQEGLAVASIAQDDPSPLPGMHRDHNVPACTASRSARPHALRAGARAKSGLEFET